jgi:hypothetical protein
MWDDTTQTAAISRDGALTTSHTASGALIAPRYEEPPLVKICLGHALFTAVLGALLPSGEHLAWLHRLMLPVVELIPNAVRLTERAPDVVFAQTFIGLSLLISWAILLFCIVAVRGYHTRAFETSIRRVLAFTYGWVCSPP